MEVSVLIAAYNAANTIERAIRSIPDCVPRILVLDDCSTDATASIVQAIGDARIRLIKHPHNMGIGAARQSLLSSCLTDYGIWLDADDMLLPGHVESLLEILQSGADYAYSNAELFDAQKDEHISTLEPAPELSFPDGIWWMFARNFIPMLGWPAVRISVARKASYQSNLRHAEDYAHLLRAIQKGAKVRFSHKVTYRQYHYSGSLSRQMGAHSESVSKILAGVNKQWLENALQCSRVSRLDMCLILSYFYNQQHAWGPAALWAEEAVNLCSEGAAKGGENRRGDALFLYATALYQMGDIKDARAHFGTVSHMQGRADALNNLGYLFVGAENHTALMPALATVVSGRQDAAASQEAANESGTVSAKACFEAALALMPHYSDARNNLACIKAGNSDIRHYRFTALPLRRMAYRDIYDD